MNGRHWHEQRIAEREVWRASMHLARLVLSWEAADHPAMPGHVLLAIGRVRVAMMAGAAEPVTEPAAFEDMPPEPPWGDL